MITKIYQILLIFSLLAAGFYFSKANRLENKNYLLEEKNSALEKEASVYKTQLEKEHNDKVELDKQYKKLEAKAKSDNSFNWYADISSSPVVIELHD